MSVILKDSLVKDLTKEDEQILRKLEELTKDHVTDLKELVSKKRKRDDATLTIHRCHFSTKKACVLTSSESLTAFEVLKGTQHH
jgi:hypothetical protein